MHTQKRYISQLDLPQSRSFGSVSCFGVHNLLPLVFIWSRFFWCPTYYMARGFLDEFFPPASTPRSLPNHVMISDTCAHDRQHLEHGSRDADHALSFSSSRVVGVIRRSIRQYKQNFWADNASVGRWKTSWVEGFQRFFFVVIWCVEAIFVGMKWDVIIAINYLIM